MSANLQDEATGRAFWKIGANEPTLDLTADIQRFDWEVADSPPALSMSVGRFRHPVCLPRGGTGRGDRAGFDFCEDRTP